MCGLFYYQGGMEMRLLENELRKREAELDKMIITFEKILSDAPQGKLRVVNDKGRTRCYIRSAASDRSGKYVRRDNMINAEAIAQRDYDILVKKAAEKESAAIKELIRIRERESAEGVYEKMTLPRKELVRKAFITDAEYAEQWLNDPYEPKRFNENDPEYYSVNGLRVRSKSEALLADVFDSYPVPMKYECPLKLWNGKIIHPDFTLLNVALRRIFIWEHFGRADDPEYMEYNVGRLNDLMLSGFYPGVNMIMTFETKNSPLNVKVVHRLVEEFLL